MLNIQKLAVALCGSAVMFGGCGMIASVSGGSGDDVLEEAQSAMDNVKGNYVALRGLMDEMLESAKSLAVIPEGIRPKHLAKISFGTFKATLEECFQENVQALEGVKTEALDMKAAAAKFSTKESLVGFSETKKAVANVLSTAKGCAPKSMSKLSRFKKGTTDEVKAFVKDKVALINNMRIMILKGIPDQAKAIAEAAKDLPLAIGKGIASLTVLEKNPIADKAGVKKNLASMNKLKGEAVKLASQVAADAAAYADKARVAATEVLRQIGTGLGIHSKKK